MVGSVITNLSEWRLKMEVNNVGAQIPSLPITLTSDAVAGDNIAGDGVDLADQADQLNAGAEAAFASVFFSLLRDILGEAQNNSGA